MVSKVIAMLLSLALVASQEHRGKDLQTDDEGYLGGGGVDDDALHASYGCHELQDISIEIYVAHGQVEMTLKGPQGEWFGFGFGSFRMEGTYAIIADGSGVADYFLSKGTVTGDQSDTKIDVTTSCLTILSDESDGFYRTIRIQRPRDHPDTFSFPSNVGNYPIISAKAAHNTHEMSYHGQNRRTDHFDFSRVGNYAHSGSGSRSFSRSASGSGSWSHSGSGSGSWSASGSGSWSHSASGSASRSHSADGSHSHSGQYHHPHYDHPPEGKFSWSRSGSGSRSFSASGSGSHSFSASGSGSHSYSASGSGSHSFSASSSGSHSHSGSGSASHSASADSSHPWGEGCCVANANADVRGRYQGEGVFRPLRCHEAFDRDVCVNLRSASGADRCLWKHGPECYEEAHRAMVIEDEQWQGPTGECVWSGQPAATNPGSPLSALSDAAKWDAQCSSLSEAKCVTGSTYTHCLWVGFAHLGDLDVERSNALSKSSASEQAVQDEEIADEIRRSINGVALGCLWDGIHCDENDNCDVRTMTSRCSQLSLSSCLSHTGLQRGCVWNDGASLVDAKRSMAVFSVNVSTKDVVLALFVLVTLVVLVVRVWSWSRDGGYAKLVQASTDTEPLLVNKV